MTGSAPTRRSAKSLRHDERGRIDIKCLSRVELVQWMADTLDETEHRANKLFQGLWQHGVTSFMDVPKLALATRERLDEHAFISNLESELVLRSEDGATKFLWKLEDGHTIESVLIPDGDRLTLCMSSQVGCAMACTFCLTGDLGLIRHLKASEIANQPMQVQQQLPPGERITNLVLMGMGEPLHNLDNLCTALGVCLDDHGMKLSHRKITVSTVGLVPKMAELARRLPVNLAVSLNATTEEQRREIMPITRKHSMAELLDACREFPMPNNKRITFEYVMLGGFNDTLEDAARLHTLLEGIPAKVNLIPYNENPDRDIKRPNEDTVKAFQHYLVSRGSACSVRTTRGVDISAACGQLGKARQQVRSNDWATEQPPVS